MIGGSWKKHCMTLRGIKLALKFKRDKARMGRAMLGDGRLFLAMKQNNGRLFFSITQGAARLS